MHLFRAIAFAVVGSLTSLATTAATADTKTGYSGVLSSLDGGLQGTVRVVDASTLQVTGYTLQGSAPKLYWWGAVDDKLSGGFRISNKQVTSTANGETLTISLNVGKTTADFAYVGLWCEQFSANFGQTKLVADGAPADKGGAGSSGAAGGSSSKPNAGFKTGAPATAMLGALGGAVILAAVVG